MLPTNEMALAFGNLFAGGVRDFSIHKIQAQ